MDKCMNPRLCPGVASNTNPTPKQLASLLHKMTAVARIVTDTAPAVDLLRSNKVVAIPTETVYGLAANALSAEACQRIFEARGDPVTTP